MKSKTDLEQNSAMVVQLPPSEKVDVFTGKDVWIADYGIGDQLEIERCL